MYIDLDTPKPSLTCSAKIAKGEASELLEQTALLEMFPKRFDSFNLL